MTNTLEKIKYYPTYVLLQKGESLVPFLQTICSGREYVYENVALVLEVYSTNANHRQQNLYGTDECSLSNFTDDGVMMGFHMGNGVKEVTEGISTAILEEKEWLLTLHLMFPESRPVIQKMDDEGNTYFDAKCKCGECPDCDWHFEYRQTKKYLRTCLEDKFAQTYEGFASFKFDMRDDSDCIVIGTPEKIRTYPMYTDLLIY